MHHPRKGEPGHGRARVAFLTCQRALLWSGSALGAFPRAADGPPLNVLRARLRERVPKLEQTAISRRKLPLRLTRRSGTLFGTPKLFCRMKE